MQRVMIIGQPGSGKSTLAKELGARTGLPVHHIDRIHWTPGWIERDRQDKIQMARDVQAQDEWIFEGGLSVTWSERLERADALIWLDVPFLVRCWRVLKRRMQYHGQTRPDLPENCPEKIDLEFAMWIWNTRNTASLKMHKLYEDAPPTKTKLRLCDLRQVESFLRGVSARAA